MDKSKKKLIKRSLITVGILFIYQLGRSLTVPGVDISLLKAIFNGSSVFAILNMIGGGALEQMSVFALGVSPYITASIIIELLSMDVIPAFSEWRKAGQKGRRKLANATRYLGLGLAVLQAWGIVYAFDKQSGILQDKTFFGYLFVILALVAGTELLCWLGDQITDKGIGNGLSIIILAGIVSGLPSQFVSAFRTLTGGDGAAWIGYVKFASYCLVYLLLILAVTIVDNSERRIPIQHSSASGFGGKDSSFLPFKVNSASVIPVIFASSVLTAPQIILSFINYGAYEKMSEALSFQKPLGLILYAALTFFFTFFYTDLQMDPSEIADNLKKGESFIPGVRPGRETKDFLAATLKRITLFGAAGLTILAVIPYLLPMIIPSLPSSLGLGGTSVILIVGISLETVKMMSSAATEDKYKYASLLHQNPNYRKSIM